MQGLCLQSLVRAKIVTESNCHRINFFNYEHFDESKDGDGTVPIQSASAFKNSILTLKVNKKWFDYRSLTSAYDWHAFFLNNGRIQNIIQRFFDEKRTLTDNWYQSIDGETEKL